MYGKRQGTLKNDSEWRTARRMRFAIQCSPRRSPFAVPFPIYFFQCSLFKVRYSMFAAPFAAPFASSFAAPFAAPFPQFSLFNVRYSMFDKPLAINRSPFANRRAIRHSPRHSLSLFNVPWRFPYVWDIGVWLTTFGDNWIVGGVQNGGVIMVEIGSEVICWRYARMAL